MIKYLYGSDMIIWALMLARIHELERRFAKNSSLFMILLYSKEKMKLYSVPMDAKLIFQIGGRSGIIKKLLQSARKSKRKWIKDGFKAVHGDQQAG